MQDYPFFYFRYRRASNLLKSRKWKSLKGYGGLQVVIGEKCHGLPMSIYLDKHTTYKSWVRKDEFREVEPISQFGRALQELGIRKLHAHSAQAKGRIERLFNTFQDRVVKEMRLHGVSTIDEANKFLVSYLPVYNRRFSVEPKKEEDLHRTVKDLDPDTIFCIKTERTLKNDHTIQLDGKPYQIEDNIRAKRVIIEELIDGTMRIRHKGVQVAFHEIVERPAKPEKERPFIPKGKGHRPPINHAWRPPWFKRSRKEEHCGNMEKAPPLPYFHSTATEGS